MISKWSRCLILIVSSIALTGCMDKKSNEARYLAQGEKYFAAGQPEKARIAFKNALRLEPTDGEPYYRLGLIDDSQGDIGHAFAFYTSAVQQNPHHYLALSRLAFFYFMGGKNEEAQSRIRMVLADQPDNLDAHALQAALLLREGNISASKKEAIEVLAKDPANVAAISVLSGLYTMQGDSAETKRVLEDGIARNPHDVSLLILKATLFQKLKDFSKVEEAYRALLTLKPDSEEFRRQAAEFYMSQRRPKDVEAVLQAGIEAAPQNWQMKRLLIDFLNATQGETAAAIQIQAYIKAFPDNDLPSFWLADLYLKHNEASQATAVLNDVVAKRGFEKSGLDARVSLAGIAYSHGEVKSAEQLIELVLQRDSENPEALFSRASIEADQGRYQSAVSDLRTILGGHTAKTPALKLLSEVLMRQGHTALAIDSMSQVVAEAPGDLSAQARLAQFYYVGGNSHRAIDLLTNIIKAAPDNPLAWESLSRINLDLKDWNAANQAIGHLEVISGQESSAALLRGKWMDLTGNQSGAIAKLSSVVAKDPSKPQAEIALVTLIDIDRRLGKLQHAVSFIQSLQPQNTMTHTFLGKIYEGLKQPDKAAAEFDNAILSGSRSAEPYIERARLFMSASQNSEAQDVLKKGMVAAPGDTRLPLLLAQIQTDAKQYQDAITLYEEVLERNPALDMAANNLAELVADYHYKDAAALERARLAAERFSGSTNPLLLDTVGWIYLRSGDLGQASSYLSRAVASGSVPPQVHYHYGFLLLKQGQQEQSKKELVLATANGAQYPGIEEAQQLLAGM